MSGSRCRDDEIGGIRIAHREIDGARRLRGRRAAVRPWHGCASRLVLPSPTVSARSVAAGALTICGRRDVLVGRIFAADLARHRLLPCGYLERDDPQSSDDGVAGFIWGTASDAAARGRWSCLARCCSDWHWCWRAKLPPCSNSSQSAVFFRRFRRAFFAPMIATTTLWFEADPASPCPWCRPAWAWRR